MKPVRLLAFVPAIVLFFAVLGTRPKPESNPGTNPAPNQEPDARLQGVWQALTIEKDGAKQPEDQARKLKIVVAAEGIYMWADGQESADGKYKTFSDGKPADFDLQFDDHRTLGIYDVQGDSLRICFVDGDKPRPKEFNAEGDATLIKLQRVVFQGTRLFSMKADGTDVRPLAQHPVFTAAGSPKMSGDGTRLTWDGWRSVLREDFFMAHILAGRADGSGAKDLARGNAPTWSPDGKRIAFSHYRDNFGDSGTWIMNADGSERRLVTNKGWYGRWSPKKNELAYIATMEDPPNICVYDFDTDSTQPLLDKAYVVIPWGMTWSPDGKRICFQGQTSDRKTEIATVSADGKKNDFHVLMDSGSPEFTAIRRCMSWGGDGRQILVSMKGKGDTCQQLYILDSEGQQSPQAVPGLDRKKNYMDFSWTPDGKRIIFTSAAPEKP